MNDWAKGGILAQGTIEAICLSPEKHTGKKQIHEAEFRIGHGLVGDAHGGSKREVSLLALEDIKSAQGALFLQPGDFAENLTTVGIQLEKLPLGSQLRVGSEVVLEVTQIGKKCHTKCEIFYKLGDCVMPKKGIFVRVLQGGTVRRGCPILCHGPEG
ncbi:MAG: MOSC domain-containing protein [Desulfovermiculus sp.]|nr:MOSC domain-containing protein [Desulfovermiculus sp.]